MGTEVVCVLPAFNEEKTVSKVAGEARKYVDQVIVIDDGSEDRTAELAAQSNATVIRHLKNMGKGAALRTGFREALERGANIVVTIDADGEHDPGDIPRLVDLVQSGKVDVVVGTRVDDRSGKSPLLRRFSRRISTLALLMFFGVHISDAQSGFRCLSRKAVEGIDFESDSFMAESEILIEAARKGLRIGEVPVTYIHVGGKFPVLKETLTFIHLCMRKILQRE